MPIKRYAIIAGAAVLLIILFQNTQIVTLRVLFWHVSMTQFLLIPLIMLLGFGVGYFLRK